MLLGDAVMLQDHGAHRATPYQNLIVIKLNFLTVAGLNKHVFGFLTHIDGLSGLLLLLWCKNFDAEVATFLFVASCAHHLGFSKN